MFNLSIVIKTMDSPGGKWAEVRWDFGEQFCNPPNPALQLPKLTFNFCFHFPALLLGNLRFMQKMLYSSFTGRPGNRETLMLLHNK